MQPFSYSTLFSASPTPVQVVSDTDNELTRRIAKQWLVSLIDQTDFMQLAELDLARFTQTSPEIISALCGAIASDGALSGLLSRASDLVKIFSGDQERLDCSIELLRQMAWREIASHCALAVDQTLALCDRLAFICARLSSSARTFEDNPLHASKRFSPLSLDAKNDSKLAENSHGQAWPRFQAGQDLLIKQLDQQLDTLNPGVELTLARLELDGADRLMRMDAQGSALLDRQLAALLGRSIDHSVCHQFHEREMCYWLVTQLGRNEFEALLLRIDHEVGESVRYLGNPMRLSIGVASAPRHALAANDLVHRAEEHMLTARACGEAIHGFYPFAENGQHLQAVRGDL